MSPRLATPVARLTNPVESAQREYLQAYENYVRCLRENGPQTIETLNALADYQNRYRTYQILLEAQKQSASGSAPP